MELESRFKNDFLKTFFFHEKLENGLFFFSWSEKFVRKSLDLKNRPYPGQKNKNLIFLEDLN